MNDWIVTIIIGILAASPGLVAIYAQRGKDRADVAEKYEALASRAADRVDNLKLEVQALEEKVTALERDLRTRDELIVEWQAGINLLIDQLVANNHKPIWRPKSHS